jgi:hypothetical protein
MTSDDLLKQEKKLFEHFSYAVATERGHTFDGFDASAPSGPHSEASQGADDVAATVPEPNAELPQNEPKPVARRRGRLGSDFLRKD